MLSDRDQRILDDIERQLCAEDSRFAAAFTTSETSELRRSSWNGFCTALVMLTLSGLLAGVSAILALVALLVAALAAGLGCLSYFRFTNRGFEKN